MIDWHHLELSVSAQCQALALARSTAYYRPEQPTERELRLRRRLDELFTAHPYYGVRRMTHALNQSGENVGLDHVRTLLRAMNIIAVYPMPRTTIAQAGAARHPYLLRDIRIERAHQVWAADITYVPLSRGWAYLAAVLDWHSRRVLGWELSDTMDTRLCLDALRMAANHAEQRPEIVNTDQGSQFTSEDWISAVLQLGARVSQDGRRRWVDNVMVERLWRTVKYECLYLVEMENLRQVRKLLAEYFDFYNHRRPHSSLAYRVPAAIRN